MTDHAEISRRLALAIGWVDDDMMINKGQWYCWTGDQAYDCEWDDYPPRLPWRAFDYRDPLVIWPIAERYNCFPRLQANGLWSAIGRHDFGPYHFTANTAAEAVALAVIGSNG